MRPSAAATRTSCRRASTSEGSMLSRASRVGCGGIGPVRLLHQGVKSIPAMVSHEYPYIRTAGTAAYLKWHCRLCFRSTRLDPFPPPQRQFRELWRFGKIAAHCPPKDSPHPPNPHIRTLAPAPAPHRYVKWVRRLCFRSTRLATFSPQLVPQMPEPCSFTGPVSEWVPSAPP